jgi:hypothetical protein
MQMSFFFFLESPQTPLNYHQIDNVSSKFLIVTMFLPNYQNIVNVPPNDETTLNKKNTKTSRKKHKTEKKKKNFF